MKKIKKVIIMTIEVRVKEAPNEIFGGLINSSHYRNSNLRRNNAATTWHR